MLNEEQKKVVFETISEDMGLVQKEKIQLKKILHNTLTVGDLLVQLKDVDPTLPLELDIVTECSKDGSASSEVAFLIETCEMSNGQYNAFQLLGVKVEVLDKYVKAFEVELLEQ